MVQIALPSSATSGLASSGNSRRCSPQMTTLKRWSGYGLSMLRKVGRPGRSGRYWAATTVPQTVPVSPTCFFACLLLWAPSGQPAASGVAGAADGAGVGFLVGLGVAGGGEAVARGRRVGRGVVSGSGVAVASGSGVVGARVGGGVAPKSVSSGRGVGATLTVTQPVSARAAMSAPATANPVRRLRRGPGVWALSGMAITPCGRAPRGTLAL